MSWLKHVRIAHSLSSSLTLAASYPSSSSMPTVRTSRLQSHRAVVWMLHHVLAGPDASKGNLREIVSTCILMIRTEAVYRQLTRPLQNLFLHKTDVLHKLCSLPSNQALRIKLLTATSMCTPLYLPPHDMTSCKCNLTRPCCNL